MDIESLDKRKVKIGYILLAAISMVCAIVSAYYGHDYIALGFIVLTSAIILACAFLMSYLHRIEKIKDVD